MTERPHAPTPGEYMGHRRSSNRDDRRRDDRDRDRDRDHRRSDRDRDRDRDYYGRDKDWRDRRSPPPRSRGYSPDHKRRRSYSRSPPPRGTSPPRGRDYDAPAAAPSSQDGGRW